MGKVVILPCLFYGGGVQGGCQCTTGGEGLLDCVVGGLPGRCKSL